MALINITNSFNAYDVVLIEGGVATLLDITSAQSGIVGVVINSEFIVVNDNLLYNTSALDVGQLVYAGINSRLTETVSNNYFNKPIGIITKSNVLGNILLFNETQTQANNITVTDLSVILEALN